MSDFHNQSTQRSRKPRRCYLTGATIEKGDKYVRFYGSFEGDFYSIAAHPVAAPIYDRHSELLYDEHRETLQFDDFLESLLTRFDQAECKAIAALPGVPEWFIDNVNDKLQTLIAV